MFRVVVDLKVPTRTIISIKTIQRHSWETVSILMPGYC